MVSTYPACFFKEDKGYTVIFPDLNFLSTQASTLDEAFKMAIDVLALYLYKPNKKAIINKPSDLNDISLINIAKELGDDNVNEGSFVNYVSVDVDEYARLNLVTSVKKTLTIPSWLNNLALENNINFSQTLQEALINKLHLD